MKKARPIRSSLRLLKAAGESSDASGRWCFSDKLTLSFSFSFSKSPAYRRAFFVGTVSSCSIQSILFNGNSAFLKMIEERKLDAIALGLAQHVYYASTHKPFWLHSSAFIMLADGTSIISTANGPNKDAAAMK